jgi:predicted CXXCH cytochrome family protein
MPVKDTIIVLIISLLFSLNAEGSQDIITVHYPPNKIVKEYGLLTISLSVPEDFEGDEIRADVNGKEKIIVISERNFRCFAVPLDPGFNKIKISAIEDGRPVDSITMDVFRRSDLISEYRISPPDYKKDYFHSKARQLCSMCHILEPNEADKKPVDLATFSSIYDENRADNITSTCYSCHKSIMSYPYVHGPASVWSCLSCHDSESTPRYSVAKPDTEMCYKCHIEQKSEWSSRKYIHGPVNIGKCTICHSPHASENPFNLFKSTWNLCVNCHFEKGSGTHVLGGSLFKEGHPTRDREDPVRIGKELTCASCHNPHASNYPHLWAFEVDTVEDLCQKCHHDK